MKIITDGININEVVTIDSDKVEKAIDYTLEYLVGGSCEGGIEVKNKFKSALQSIISGIQEEILNNRAKELEVFIEELI